MRNAFFIRLIVLFFLSFFSTTFLYSKTFEGQDLHGGVIDSNVTLKGNIQENVSEANPLTGIGVIGIRFIHQNGFPSYVEQVYPGSPAMKAGLRTKDLIFAIDGIRTDKLNSDSVYQLLAGEPGSRVSVFVTRGSSMFNVTLIRTDLANLSAEIQNRYLSGPIAVPFNTRDLTPYH